MQGTLEEAVVAAAGRVIPEDCRLDREEDRSGETSAIELVNFESAPVAAGRTHFQLAVLPVHECLSPEQEKVWLRLRDRTLDQGSTLVVFYEDADRGPVGQWADFASERLDLIHPGFLCLPAAQLRSGTWVVEPDFECVQTLSCTLLALWNGTLAYVGPVEGMQLVGVELMADKCWKCKAELRTVTGLVIPDRLVSGWKTTEWRYFQSLLRLASLDEGAVAAILNRLPLWRAEDPCITPIEMRSTRGSGTSYWAATCPICGSVRGDFHAAESRLDYLHDLESRRQGLLSYRPLKLNLSREMLSALFSEAQCCAHSCPAGWELQDD